MPSAAPWQMQGRKQGRNKRVDKGVGGPRCRGGTWTGGFSAWVPIPNGRGRHRAAPFGVGPWDGAQVASQQGPTLRPGQRYCSRQERAVEPDKTERRDEEASFGPVVRSELPQGNLRSLPWGPTRVGPWMRWLSSAMGEAGQHVAVYGVALAVRNSHQIRPHRPGSVSGPSYSR